MKCNECKGTGRIELLVSSKPCVRCNGLGTINSEEDKQKLADCNIAPEHWYSTRVNTSQWAINPSTVYGIPYEYWMGDGWRIPDAATRINNDA